MKHEPRPKPIPTPRQCAWEGCLEIIITANSRRKMYCLRHKAHAHAQRQAEYRQRNIEKCREGVRKAKARAAKWGGHDHAVLSIPDSATDMKPGTGPIPPVMIQNMPIEKMLRAFDEGRIGS